MPTLTTAGSNPTELSYSDTQGIGRPVVLIHGWPASQQSWQAISAALQEAGHRVIVYDRRGFGDSGQPAEGYDYDTFAADLDDLLAALDLMDAVLVGFSMGGGEVARYVANYGTARITGAVFVSAITPCLDASLPDNPEGGFTPEAAAGMQAGLRDDPEGFLTGFLTNFHSVPGDGEPRLMVPREQIWAAIEVAKKASLDALVICIGLWLTDFRADLAAMSVPTLVIHGDGDQIVPFPVSGRRMPHFVPDAEVHVISGGPHGVLASHPDEVAAALLAFLA
jgi:pimeloyl-ACP methyl ester carboxylesterase